MYCIASQIDTLFLHLSKNAVEVLQNGVQNPPSFIYMRLPKLKS